MANKDTKLFSNKDEIRRAILAAEDIPEQVVEVPEWGGAFRVRGLNGLQRDLWEGSLFTVKGDTVEMRMRNMRAKLVAMCLVDEKGKRVFNDGADVNDLGGKSAKALSRVYQVARELSGIGEDELEKIKENFEDALDGDSSSG